MTTEKQFINELAVYGPKQNTDAAIRALAYEVIRLDKLLRQVHPGLFGYQDDNVKEPVASE